MRSIDLAIYPLIPSFLLRSCSLDLWRKPCTVKDCFVGPIGPHVERERAIRSRQPVALPILAGRFSASIQRQRTVGVVLECLILGAKRIALQRVWIEQMEVVVQGE